MSDPLRRLSRRHLLAGTAASVGTANVGMPAFAQQPNAGTAANTDAFRRLCITLVGVESLPDDPLQQLLGLLTDDESSAAGLQELLNTNGGKADLNSLSPDANTTVSNILQFWYLGNFNGAPLENRAERFGGLISHHILPYITIQAVCKNFGYWAEDLELPDRT